MNVWTRRMASPSLMPFWLVGLVLGGLLIGFEPVGGDPDRLYRPLKEELSRSLGEGRLPFWSDRFGLGMPLLAESHVAALYPPNWFLYSAFGVPAAYRLAMWLHYLFLAASTFAYARFLGISSRGAAIAAVGFTFCGFQAIHSSHEPFYQALPFLPLSLLLAERYLAVGGGMGLVLLACSWGAQLTLGHFQLQMWTGGLVLMVGLWRVLTGRSRWSRSAGLALALGWGASMAALQLVSSWELARFVGFTHRSAPELSFYSFPPAHWAELAIPTLFRGIPGGPEATYWYALGTSGYEACLYVGTVPLMLAWCALLGGRDRELAPWWAIVGTSLALAMLPAAWPRGYALVVSLPGFGLFRGPGRYTVLTSLGLCLAAGRGLDRAETADRLAVKLAAAWAFALAAAGWAVYWALRPDHREVLAGPRLAWCLGLAALVWTAATLMLLAWKRNRIGYGAVLAAATLELGGLYYTATTDWGWAVTLPDQSPVLDRLAREPGVRHVAGPLHDLPIRAGLSPIFPYTGFAPPPPHPLLELAGQREAASSTAGLTLFRRFGVTHGVWDGPIDPDRAATIFEADDPVLDRLVFKPPGSPPHARWRIVRYPEPFPPARAAVRVRIAQDQRGLIAGLSYGLDPNAVWYLNGDQPEISSVPRATSARVVSWDGRDAVVEHDGTCDLVINRTYYPGWVVSVNGGLERPVARSEGGIQAVTLEGQGTSRASFRFRPNGASLAARVSLTAVALAAFGLILAPAWRKR